MKLIKLTLLLSTFSFLEVNATDKGPTIQVMRHLGTMQRNMEMGDVERNHRLQMMADFERSPRFQDHAGFSNENDPFNRPGTPPESIVSTAELIADHLAMERVARRLENFVPLLDLENQNTENLNSVTLPQTSGPSILSPSPVEPSPQSVLSGGNYFRLLSNPSDGALLEQITRASFQAMLDYLRGMSNEEAREGGLINRNVDPHALAWTLEKALANWGQTYHPDALSALHHGTGHFRAGADYLNAHPQRYSQEDLFALIDQYEQLGSITDRTRFKDAQGLWSEAAIRKEFPEEFIYRDDPYSQNLHSFGAAEWRRFIPHHPSGRDGPIYDASDLYQSLKVLPVFLPNGLTAPLVLYAIEHGYRLENLAGHPFEDYQRYSVRVTITKEDLEKYKLIARGIAKSPESERAALHESLRRLMVSRTDDPSTYKPLFETNPDGSKLAQEWQLPKTYWSPKTRSWVKYPDSHWKFFDDLLNPNKARL